MAALVADVASGSDRIVKRLVPGGAASYPAGLARLTEERHLLVVIDEDQLEDKASVEEPLTDVQAGTMAPAAAAIAADPSATAVDAVATSELNQNNEPAAIASTTDAVQEEAATPGAVEDISTPAPQGSDDDAGQVATDHDQPANDSTPTQHDHWYFHAGEEEPAQTDQPAAATGPVETPPPILEAVPEGPAQAHAGLASPAERPAIRTIDRTAAPVRFVWRTDAEGKFSALSPEFADIVGKAAADVIGRRFKDVAATFGLDTSGEIAGLLERRDTWSGRSVLWPVVGTDLKIPVDLAALPVYGRSRAFEGFRGFGVARTGDAVVDPEAIGMALVPNGGAPLAPAPEAVGPAHEEPKTPDPFKGEVPALTIVPKPERRFADKVIRLAEHRQPANDKGLSTLERSAFREIGERLKKDSGATEPEAAKPNRDKPPEPAAEAVIEPAAETTIAPKAETKAPAETSGEVRSATDASPTEAPTHADGITAANLENETAEREAADVASEVDAGDLADLARLDGARPDEAAHEAPTATDTAPLEQPAHAGEIPAAGPAHETPGNQDVASETIAGDEADLARLDGARPDEAAHDEPAEALPHATGSLLDYAGQSDDLGPVADDSEAARVSEPVPTAHQDVTEPVAADEAPIATKATAGAAVDDDSMTAADFRDAEDSEDWAQPEDETVATSHDQVAAPAGEPVSASMVETPVERPRLFVPPLKTEGFVPSAFTSGEENKAPDTSLLSKLPVPLLIHSGDHLHYANEEFLNLTGYATTADLEDAGGLGALFADPYADDSASDGSDHALRLKTRDGQEFPIEAILRSVPWRDGKALMLVVRRSGDDDVAAAHVTADEQTQPDIPELKARVAEMRTIIDTATDGVVLIGRDGTIRSISRPAEALFGFDSDDVTGKPFASLFAIESQRAARDYLEGLSEPGVASVLNDGREVIGREAQGRFIPLFMTIGRLPSDSGFCAVVRDITQWKRAEEDLTQARAVAERASSQKTDFLARISHEIRTPLNAIIGFSELMVDEKFGPVANDRYRDYLRDINRSGNHVLDLVNDLLDISKIEAGQQEMAYEAVSLNDTLAETVAMMQPQANRERVIIRSSFASRLPEVVADLRSVRQIALNILSNAIRYTQAGGQVIVSTAYETSGDVVMRVRDTGIGMSPAEIEQALKPFKQINALKRGRGDGTGLGLPLTKAMVEANRARFTINSTPGEGTLVEVAFPSTRVLAD
ncbi:MAG: PAS domain S-box protein [Mesorhizobium sp.]